MSADRNLLLGVIALQNNIIDRHQLVTAFDRWATDKRRDLADVLQELKAIGSPERTLLEALVKLHLSKHDNDPQASLAAMSPGANIVQLLKPVADQDLQASLGHLSFGPKSAPNFDPLATQLPASNSQSFTGSRFRVLRPHARGGLGEVFVAQDDELHRTVALKQIRDSHANDPECRTRFMVEAEITGALEHPGIVPVYGLGHYADGRPYYAMRFIRGDSLKEAIEGFHKARQDKQLGGEGLALRGLLGRMIDVCEAIEYAHCRGILHRDLKPGNVMVGRFGETLVVDWGLARTMDSADPEHSVDEGVVRPVSTVGGQATLMGSAVGTPQYMSPEQALGQLNLLGPRSDVYSLGATLFCLLSGEAPVDGENLPTVLQRVQRGELRSLRELNPALDRGLIAICYKALALNPKDRYGRACELAEDLQRWLADEPVLALPETWLSRTGRWARRHRSLVATIAAATLLLVVTLGVSLWFVSAAHRRETVAHNRATASFRAARDAVDRYFTQVSETTLLNQPGLQPLRRELLHDALGYYTAFLTDHQVDPDLQADLAKATFHAGRIHEELGELAVASQSYSKAGEQLAKLGQSNTPDSQQLTETYSDVLTAAGRLKQKQSAYADSVKLFTQALELRQQLVKSQPESVQYQRKLANVYMNLGILSLAQDDLDAAERSIQQAQAIRQPLSTDPKNVELRRDYAKGYYNLGVIAARRDQTAQSQSNLKQAAGLFEELLVKQPSDLELRWLLATCYRLAGDAVAGREDVAESVSYYQQSAKILQSLASRNPEVFEYQQALAGLHMNLGEVQADGAAGEAVASLSKAIEILQGLVTNSATPAIQRDLALARRTRGELTGSTDSAAANQDIQAAVQLLEKLVAENPGKPAYAEELQATKALLIQ